MGTRLYEEFMKKLKVPPVQKFNKKKLENKEIVIAIPLKGGGGVRLSYLNLVVTC
jgi:hypothetical protein